MDEVSLLPSRSKSKRTRSSNTSRESSRRDHTAKSPTSTSSTPRTTRPSLGATRTASAPLVPLSRDTDHVIIGEELDPFSQRDSVASIKDDPFFRNYQSPHSVSLARELRSATYSERLRDEASPKDPPPRSNKRPSVDDSVKLPVRTFISTRKYKASH
jgi:hypothetical protein